MAMAGGVVGVAMADPGLPDVGAHRHYINGQEVGPRICDHPGNQGIQDAFSQFHANHHVVTQPALGPIAPGLHNGKGGEITASGCGG